MAIKPIGGCGISCKGLFWLLKKENININKGAMKAKAKIIANILVGLKNLILINGSPHWPQISKPLSNFWWNWYFGEQ